MDTDAVRTMLRRVRLVDLDDADTLQLLKLTGLKGEQLERVPRIQHFGLSSNPPAGAEGLLAALGGRSDRAVVVGLEHKDFRPTAREAGSTAIYDANGQIVSLVKNKIRIVGSDTIEIVATTIVLDGNVKLGGADANRPASASGTLDSAGHAETSNFATKVWVK